MSILASLLCPSSLGWVELEGASHAALCGDGGGDSDPAARRLHDEWQEYGVSNLM